MKNKKRSGGFSLIEILAIIIVLILIFIMVVPKVMNTVYEAKNNSMKSVLEITEDWFKKQDLTSNSGIFLSNLDILQEMIDKQDVAGVTIYDYQDTDEELKAKYQRRLQELDLKEVNVSQVYAYLFSNGKVCIVIPKIPETSTFYNVKYWILDGEGHAVPNKDTDVKYYSDGCIGSKVLDETTGPY